MSPGFSGVIWLAVADFGDGLPGCRCRGQHGSREGLILQLLELEDRDLLRLAVFEDRKGAGLEIGHRVAVLALDDDVLHHQTRRGFELERLDLAPRGVASRLLRGGRHQPSQECRGDRSHN